VGTAKVTMFSRKLETISVQNIYQLDEVIPIKYQKNSKSEIDVYVAKIS
jgi:hypothetical protein